MVWFPVMFHSPSFILLTELQYADIYADSQYTHKDDQKVYLTICSPLLPFIDALMYPRSCGLVNEDMRTRE